MSKQLYELPRESHESTNLGMLHTIIALQINGLSFGAFMSAIMESAPKSQMGNRVCLMKLKEPLGDDDNGATLEISDKFMVVHPEDGALSCVEEPDNEMDDTDSDSDNENASRDYEKCSYTPDCVHEILMFRWSSGYKTATTVHVVMQFKTKATNQSFVGDLDDVIKRLRTPGKMGGR